MVPVILSGGAGTRLWPVSRAKFPKQFCQFFEESLLDKTIKRLMPFGSPWVVTTEDLRTLTEKTFQEKSLNIKQILFEPQGRNTAPAVGLLLRKFELLNQTDAIVSFFPADHLVQDEAAFQATLQLAETMARQGNIVTLGIQPTYPATGFGYIETAPTAENKVGALQAFPVLSFREKPDQKTAEDFLESGRFFWNAGMFVFKVSDMIAHFKKHLPEHWRLLSELEPGLNNLSKIYAKLPSISFDYGIMEKVSQQVCVPCDMGWTDLGSWDDLAKVLSQDSSSVNQAHVIEDQAQNNFVFSTYQKTVGLVGVDDLLIVDTPDALMISRKGASQNIKNVVEKLKTASSTLPSDHLFEIRPWGRFEILRDEAHFKSKVITVNPHSQISYQSHDQREELWVMVKGEGEVVLNDEVYPLKKGDSIKIPLRAKHRIRNTSDAPLEFVEVQTGTYFGEDDIKRYQDDYGRSEN